MLWFKRTRTSASVSPTSWEKRLTDTLIYALAFGGFYIGWSTIHALALRVGFPADQAVVVSCLADLAILAYSWKAKQEVEAGRSARVIRLIVAALSFATFYLQIREAWPAPSAVVMHALAPVVWIIGHEMMLRGKLRTARARMRQEQIDAGLRPAPLPSFRTSQWILSPWRTFQAWRLTRLWETGRDVVIAELAAKWRAKGRTRRGQLRPVPAAWRTPTARTVARAVGTFKAPEQPKQLPLVPPQGKAALPAPTLKAKLRLADGPDAPAEVQSAFLAALPPAPAPGRTAQEALEYVDAATEVARRHGVRATGIVLAELLDCGETYISHIRRERREREEALAASQALAAAS